MRYSVAVSLLLLGIATLCSANEEAPDNLDENAVKPVEVASTDASSDTDEDEESYWWKDNEEVMRTKRLEELDPSEVPAAFVEEEEGSIAETVLEQTFDDFERRADPRGEKEPHEEVVCDSSMDNCPTKSAADPSFIIQDAEGISKKPGEEELTQVHSEDISQVQKQEQQQQNDDPGSHQKQEQQQQNDDPGSHHRAETPQQQPQNVYASYQNQQHNNDPGSHHRAGTPQQQPQNVYASYHNQQHNDEPGSRYGAETPQQQPQNDYGSYPNKQHNDGPGSHHRDETPQKQPQNDYGRSQNQQHSNEPGSHYGAETPQQQPQNDYSSYQTQQHNDDPGSRRAETPQQQPQNDYASYQTQQHNDDPGSHHRAETHQQQPQNNYGSYPNKQHNDDPGRHYRAETAQQQAQNDYSRSQHPSQRQQQHQNAGHDSQEEQLRQMNNRHQSPPPSFTSPLSSWSKGSLQKLGDVVRRFYLSVNTGIYHLAKSSKALGITVLLDSVVRVCQSLRDRIDNGDSFALYFCFFFVLAMGVVLSNRVLLWGWRSEKSQTSWNYEGGEYHWQIMRELNGIRYHNREGKELDGASVQQLSELVKIMMSRFDALEQHFAARQGGGATTNLPVCASPVSPYHEQHFRSNGNQQQIHHNSSMSSQHSVGPPLQQSPPHEELEGIRRSPLVESPAPIGFHQHHHLHQLLHNNGANTSKAGNEVPSVHYSNGGNSLEVFQQMTDRLEQRLSLVMQRCVAEVLHSNNDIIKTVAGNNLHVMRAAAATLPRKSRDSYLQLIEKTHETLCIAFHSDLPPVASTSENPQLLTASSLPFQNNDIHSSSSNNVEKNNQDGGITGSARPNDDEDQHNCSRNISSSSFIHFDDSEDTSHVAASLANTLPTNGNIGGKLTTDDNSGGVDNSTFDFDDPERATTTDQQQWNFTASSMPSMPPQLAPNTTVSEIGATVNRTSTASSLYNSHPYPASAAGVHTSGPSVTKLMQVHPSVVPRSPASAAATPIVKVGGPPPVSSSPPLAARLSPQNNSPMAPTNPFGQTTRGASLTMGGSSLGAAPPNVHLAVGRGGPIRAPAAPTSPFGKQFHLA